MKLLIVLSVFVACAFAQDTGFNGDWLVTLNLWEARVRSLEDAGEKRTLHRVVLEFQA